MKTSEKVRNHCRVTGKNKGEANQLCYLNANRRSSEIILYFSTTSQVMVVIILLNNSLKKHFFSKLIHPTQLQGQQQTPISFKLAVQFLQTHTAL